MAVYCKSGDGMRGHCVSGVLTCALPIYIDMCIKFILYIYI